MLPLNQLAQPAIKLVSDEILDHYGQLCVGNRTSNDLQQRAAVAEWLTTLAGLRAEHISDRPVVDRQSADCCVAGVKLLHGQLDPSHEISQSIKTLEGSFWHGIMHRLEGDYWNSKYWFGQVGNHPVAQSLQAEYPGYPVEFIDRCESAVESENSTTDPGLQTIARQEWCRLFNYCFQQGFEA